jgi:hypothetical protein
MLWDGSNTITTRIKNISGNKQAKCKISLGIESHLPTTK